MNDSAMTMDDLSKWFRLKGAWKRLVSSMEHVGRQWQEFRRTWPGLRFVLGGLRFVVLWQVTGPEGGGPWLETPQAAAEWIEEEVRSQGESVDAEEAWQSPGFTLEELAGLRKRRDHIDRNEWTIKGIAISRHRLTEEWGGW